MTPQRSYHQPSVWWSILSGLTIAAGFLAIAAPMAAGLAVTLVVGWLIAFSAATHLWLTFEPQRLESRVWHVLAAIVYGIGGFYIIAQPALGLLSLTLFVSVMFFAGGIFRVAAYFNLRNRAGASWLLADGILTILLGAFIYAGWPESAHWVVGTLVGVTLILNGIANLMFSIACRRAAKAAGDGEIEGHIAVSRS